MSFDQQPNQANVETELNELRINSMVKAVSTQREQALNQTAKLVGDLAVEKARVTLLESAQQSAAMRIEGLIRVNAGLVARVRALEAESVAKDKNPAATEEPGPADASSAGSHQDSDLGAGPVDFHSAVAASCLGHDKAPKSSAAEETEF